MSQNEWDCLAYRAYCIVRVKFLASAPSFLQEEVVTDKVLILVTASNRREARKIARRLVELRLAACVNITQPVQSIYRWEGKLQEDKEYLLLIKSTRDLFPEVRQAILKNHSYKIPEIICLPIVEGSPEYLNWVGESVKQPRPVEVVTIGGEHAP